MLFVSKTEAEVALSNPGGGSECGR